MKSQFFSIVQLSVALAVFTQLEPHIEELTKTWGDWGKIATSAAALVASSVLVVLIGGKLLAPLKVVVEWSRDRVVVRGPCDQLARRPGFNGPLTAYEIQVSCRSTSLRSSLTALLCREYGATVTATISPSQSVDLVRELAHGTASVQGSSVKFDISRIATGTLSWATVSVEPIAEMPRLLRLDCRVAGAVGRVPRLLTGMLISVECSLAEIEISEISGV